MDKKIIAEIVKKTFAKAKTKCATHTKNALSVYLEDYFEKKIERLSARTFIRTYEKFIEESNKERMPNPHTIDLFCNYLGYQNYIDYTEKNRPLKPICKLLEYPNKHLKKYKKYVIGLVISCITLVPLFAIFENLKTNIVTSKDALINSKCMVWEETSFQIAPCNSSTRVLPFNENKMKFFRKIEVAPTYKFFSRTGEPLVWYCKLNKNAIEFFSAPGIHPETGKTLKAVTEYIIEKYVPLHDISDKSLKSFIGDN